MKKMYLGCAMLAISFALVACGDDSTSASASGNDDKEISSSSSNQQKTSSSSERSKTEYKCGKETYDPQKQFCAKWGGEDEAVYNKVTIGEGANEQTWMAENLNYETAEGSYCYYDEDTYCNRYGRLYTWAAAKTACPDGWRLPTLDEWKKLVTNVDANLTGPWNEDWETDNVAGKAMKSKSGWNGSNESGFSALPAGGMFFLSRDENWATYFLSDTEFDTDNVVITALFDNSESLFFAYSSKSDALSVRCIQD